MAFVLPIMLEALDLACQRGHRVLFTGLSFALTAGELLLVAGPNGSGKTSLLRILCGLSQPAQGEVRWAGRRIHDLGEAFRSQLFYLGHHNGVKDDLTALENLRINAALGGDPLSVDAALAALDRIGLSGREDLPVKALSQGQRRRVALARLLVSRAPLWILDEPLTALDARAIGLIQDRLAAHLAQGGMAVITTHQPIAVEGVVPRRVELSAP